MYSGILKKTGFMIFIFTLLFMTTNRTAAQPGDNIRLAYVRNNTVMLADYEGTPLTNPGPELGEWQSARLFWTPDGETLYVATRQGLFVTGAQGGAAVRLPGEFGLTVVPARHGGVLYNIDVDNPQPVSENIAAFPLRETNLASAEGGRGRMVTIIGNYQISTVNVALTHAAAVYARGGGLLEGGRPQIWTSYGGSVFYSCCFPNPGLGMLSIGSGEIFTYDEDFLPGAAALNATSSRLVGPTTDGIIRTIDLITSGTRDYIIDIPGGVGPIERMAWSLDESAIYFISREAPTSPLELVPGVTYPADTRSANAVLWKLDIINGHTNQVASFGDVFGVPSLAVTNEFIFAVVVERNEELVNALNTGVLDPSIQPGDPLLDGYVPRSVLWRVDLSGTAMFAIDENIWGVIARPY